MNTIDIISYETFKRKNNPTIYECRDGVKAWKGSDIFFTTLDMNHFYQQSDIELIPIEEPVIVVSRLKEVLKQATEVGYINEYGAHRIIDLIKDAI